jgi:hypothetical protein
MCFPEVHQLPDRVVLVGLGQLTTPIPGDLDVTDEPQVGAIEVGQFGGDALDALDTTSFAPSARQPARHGLRSRYLPEPPLIGIKQSAFIAAVRRS